MSRTSSREQLLIPIAEREMKILKIESDETLSREAAGARLHEIADDLSSHNDIEMEWSGKHLRLHVPDEVQMEIEIEIEDDETEFEIEFKWRHRD
jgi:amphi-Trp domain-containing protein